MKRTMVFGAVVAAALAVGVDAQSGASGAQSGGQDSSRQNQQVTMTGCLHSDTGAGGSSASGSAAAKAGGGTTGGRFILTNAKMSASGTTGSATGPAGSGAAGSAAPAGMVGGMSRVKLEGGNDSDLQKYANTQVEIRGTLDRGSAGKAGATGSSSGAAGAAGAGSGGAGTPRTSGSGQDTDAATLRVSSVRQVSPSCSGS